MRVIKNFLWNAGYQVFVLLVPLVTVPYITRVLGPRGVGINAYTNSIVQYFILLGSLGINSYGNRQVAYYRNDEKKLSETFWEITFLRFGAIGLSVIFYLIFIFMSDRYRVYYLAQGIMLIGTAFDISWLFQGLEDFRVTVTRNLIVKILSLICVFTLVNSKQDVAIYILILAVSQAIGYLTLWPYLRTRVSFVRIERLNIRQHIRPSVTLLLPQIATQVYLQLNKTMLGSMRGVTDSGYFDSADKIVKMLLAVITATGTVLLPHVAHNFSEGNMTAVKHSLKVSMHVILALAIPISAGLTVVSQPFTLLFFGPKFSQVGPLIAMEAIVIVLIGISNAVGIQFLLPTNQMSAFTRSVVTGSILNIILNFPLIYFWGAFGATISTVISETAVVIYQLVVIREQFQLIQLFSESGKYIVSTTVMVCFILLIKPFFSASIFGLLMVVFCAIVVYIITLMCLNPKILKGYVADLFRK